MSANIKVTLSTSKLEVAAGDSVVATISIRNQSQTVDQFAVEVEGLDSTWWKLSAPSVSLFPGDQEEVRLTIRTPKEAEAGAGSYPFQVKVVSQANPQEAAVAEAYLILHGSAAWEANMSPNKVTGQRGVYRIKLNNNSDAGTTLVFKGEDTEGKLNYQFDHDEITVLDGKSARVNLKVQPKKGAAKKQYNFKVTVKPWGKESPPTEVKVLNGQLEYGRRKFPWWIWLIILGLGIAAFAAWAILSGLWFQPAAPSQPQIPEQATPSEPKMPEPVTPSTSTPAALQDVTWVLRLYGEPANPQAVLPHTTITIKFDSATGTFSGSSGCNTYNASYVINGNKLSIIANIWKTMMACTGPRMQQESQYLSILKMAQGYGIQNSKLTIDCSDQVLIYERE